MGFYIGGSKRPSVDSEAGFIFSTDGQKQNVDNRPGSKKSIDADVGFYIGDDREGSPEQLKKLHQQQRQDSLSTDEDILDVLSVASEANTVSEFGDDRALLSPSAALPHGSSSRSVLSDDVSRAKVKFSVGEYII